MVTDEDVLEKEDAYIFDNMRTFISTPEVAQTSAAKQLLVLIDRAVRILCISIFPLTIQ